MKKELGCVIEIFSAHKDSKGLPRPIVKELMCIENYGIQNDKFANDNLDKTVMIVGLKSYDIAKENGMELAYGSYGENILFDFDPHEFELGTIFDVGDVYLEVTEKCTICNHLSIFGAHLPKLIKKHRGMYCKILEGGVITKSSHVRIKND